MENQITTIIVLVVISAITIWRISNKSKTKTKFYEAALSGDYTDLLYFLLIGLDKVSIQKKILGKTYFSYNEYIERGLLRYFDSRLNVRVTSSRIMRIASFFEHAKTEQMNKAPNLGNKKNEQYWETIEKQLEKVIYYCGPAYFASCYVGSLNENKNEESRAREFLINFYNEGVNSHDEIRKKQFYLFVELVNQEIDKYQNYDIPQEKKSLVLKHKLIVESNTTSSTKIWAETEQ